MGRQCSEHWLSLPPCPAAISRVRLGIVLNLSELRFLQSRNGIRVSVSQGSSDASETKSSPNTKS